MQHHHLPRTRSGLLRRSAGILLLGAALIPTGCIRQASKGATEGVLDAMENHVADDQAPASGARGDGKSERESLASGAGTTAGRGGDGPSGGKKRGIIEPVARDAVSGTLEALDNQAAPLQRVSRAAATSVTSGVLEGAYGSRAEVTALVGDVSGAAGQAIVKAVAEELRRQAAEGMGISTEELGDGAALLARRTAAAAVAGATEQLAVDLSTCPPEGPCLALGIQRASRAVAMGMAEGVSRKTSPWDALIPFALGAVVAGGAAALIGFIRRRRQVVVPGVPVAATVATPQAPIRPVRHVPRFRPHAPEAIS
ncbi:hypothetical protein [Chondromyces apiculatus]|uniref:hypothetical protein n=1 Tax=Chondromyces apiculatus TaxID=51 RepID=UPI0012DD5B39|nr:hypothetical protein [Chondromyces apiculatus]